MKATVEGAKLSVGNPALMEELGLSVPEDPRLREIARQGKTVIYAAADGDLVGAIGLADVVRDESREAVRALRGMGHMRQLKALTPSPLNVGGHCAVRRTVQTGTDPTGRVR